MSKICITLFTLLFLSTIAFAQSKSRTTTTAAKETPPEETSDNVVNNGGFENTATKTLKNYGQLQELSTGWFAATQSPCDVFGEGVKSLKAAIPTNEMGNQTAHSGMCYAGIVAYSKDPKRTRTYLEAELNQQLKKDQLYCVRVQVSLGENSKFAVNNVGVLLSDRKIDQPNSGIIALEPQIKQRNNTVLKTMDGWETICMTYAATGLEEYIVVGCYGLDEKLTIEKPKRPAGSTGVQQLLAYYYIDNIEITPIEAQSQCFCGKAEDREADLIYSRSLNITPDMKPAAVVSATNIWFGFLSSDMESMFEEDLNRVLGVLKANPNLSLDITGHSDNDEMSEAKINARYGNLALKRADKLKDWFVEQGIQATRVNTSTKDNIEPASTMPTPMSKAQNRRVTFAVK
ncbi:MAG: OmpA family protein [Flavobacteriales bacterium]|nr:OmpA family protein [Flavobacteriales bacterium]